MNHAIDESDSLEGLWGSLGFDAPPDVTCGDGVVEGDEECDPGFFVFDACCTNACTLSPGCVCANTDPCCTNGVISLAGHVQASALHDAAHDVRHATGFPCH